jgi:tetratricopeptide (TPR) repeat protein
MRLNPYDALSAFSHLRYGMCLHHLGQHSEAERYFQRAIRDEPNFYYVVTLMGWHYVQLGDFATAKTWFERSLRLNIVNNRAAQNWLEIVNRKLNEASSK